MFEFTLQRVRAVFLLTVMAAGLIFVIGSYPLSLQDLGYFGVQYASPPKRSTVEQVKQLQPAELQARLDAVETVLETKSQAELTILAAYNNICSTLFQCNGLTSDQVKPLVLAIKEQQANEAKHTADDEKRSLDRWTFGVAAASLMTSIIGLFLKTQG